MEFRDQYCRELLLHEERSIKWQVFTERFAHFPFCCISAFSTKVVWQFMQTFYIFFFQFQRIWWQIEKETEQGYNVLLHDLFISGYYFNENMNLSEALFSNGMLVRKDSC